MAEDTGWMAISTSQTLKCSIPGALQASQMGQQHLVPPTRKPMPNDNDGLVGIHTKSHPLYFWCHRPQTLIEPASKCLLPIVQGW
jgi:hypothetical protein